MELIPILSLIVLVATISTFILAVGAYVLYKIRERKGRVANAPQAAAIEAELVAPVPLVNSQKDTQQVSRMTYVQEQMPTRVTELGYQRQNMRIQEPMKPVSPPPMRPTFIGNAPDKYTEEKFVRRQERPTQDNFAAGKKFMRYTTEGYVEPKKDEQKKEDKLRWR